MRSIIEDKALEPIVLEHILKVRQLEEAAGRVLRERVEHLITRLLLQINQNLKNMAYLKSYDQLYYHVEDTKLAYEAFISDFDENSQYVEESNLKALFIGLRTKALNFLSIVPVKSDNPITYERMVLINSAILRIKQYWMTQLEEGLKTCNLDNNISGDGLKTLMNRQVQEFFAQGMLNSNQMIDDSIAILSNFEEGKKYESFTKKQVKELSTLVMSQNDVSQAQLKTEREKELVNGWTEHLMKCHNQSIEVLDELEDKPIALGKTAEVIHMEQIETLLDVQTLSDQEHMTLLYQHATQIKNESVTALCKVLEDEVAYTHAEVLKKIKKEARSYELLSGQLTLVFAEIVHLLDRLGDNYKTEEGRIIAESIRHTMALKLESISAMQEAYTLGKRALLNVSDDEIDEKKEVLLQKSQLILDDLLGNNHRVLTRQHKQFSDALELIEDKQTNYDMAFLKNDLLFELRTFEEFIEYSLKKLIELEPNHATEMTKIMISAMEKSRELLSSHAIELIIPKAHDKFEAKAHEAIAAESLDEFSEGEVIKTINVGYRKKATIIIRANVMVAK